MIFVFEKNYNTNATAADTNAANEMETRDAPDSYESVLSLLVSVYCTGGPEVGSPDDSEW